MTLQQVVESRPFERFILAVIVINAITLGLETSPAVMAKAGGLLKTIDTAALVIFVIELLLKMAVYRWRFFRSSWRNFDLLVVGISLLPASEGLSVLRSLRVLRTLRLMSMVPKMRSVVQALLDAIPAMGSVIALLALVYYVFAVMATKLFASAFPQWFGSLGASMYSLFQIMTLESWSMGIVRPVMEVYPLAWLFFIPFILCTTFAVLNLFVAIVVNSMQEAAAEGDVSRQSISHDVHDLADTLVRLEKKIDALQRDGISRN